jgi:hypothetical protein
MRKEGRLIHERKKPMMKIIAAAAFVVAPWQPAHAQAIVGSIPEEFRGDWCQENTKDNVFKPGGCKLRAGSLSIDRLTLDTGRLSCGFYSGAASDGTLQMRMLCTDPEDKESLMYGAQLKLLPGKKIELILEPMDQSDERSAALAGLANTGRRVGIACELALHERQISLNGSGDMAVYRNGSRHGYSPRHDRK